MHFLKYSSKLTFLWGIPMSQFENRPTSQQEMNSNLLTWAINLFFKEWGVLTILSNNSWSLNFHPLPSHESSWYWEFFGSTDALEKAGASAKGGGGGGLLNENISFFFLYCLLPITPLSILAVPLSPPSLKHQDRTYGLKYRRKKWVLWMLWGLKKWCFSTFPLNLSFNIFVS